MKYLCVTGFCFACIDNWATITNLCPICKNEFQLITCLPVRFVGPPFILIIWTILTKRNKYAVVCLDGDGCKIRNKLPTEEDLNLDTSIACDSCDIWYHAFCVGFDPEGTSHSSWLCPRLEDISEQNLFSDHDQRNSCSLQSVGSVFSGKVSISIADAGETAVVVSMVEGKQSTSSEEDLLESETNVNACTEEEALMTNVSSCATDFEQCKYRNLVDTDDDQWLTRNAAGNQSRSEFSLEVASDKAISSDSLVQENFFGSLTSLEASSDGDIIHHNNGEPGTPFPFSMSEAVLDKAEAQLGGDSTQPSNNVFSLSVDEFVKNDSGNVADLVDQENSERKDFIRKDFEIPISSLMNDSNKSDQFKKRERDAHANAATDVCREIDGFDEKCNMLPQRRRIDPCFAMDPREWSDLASSSKDLESDQVSGKEDGTSDIMSIVQDTGCKSSITQSSSTDGRHRGVGLRVKKILWRSGHDNESSVLVQKLRNEIRERVCDKDISDISRIVAFDGKLLSAFRAAIARPENKTVSKVDPPSVRAKNILLQKGKVRENLTKKVYATTSGRRRRAWDRDRAVEFWKHRCLSSEPEKVRTLQSVLDLLKKVKSPLVHPEIEQGPETQASNSLLSRLYLADTSVLPRTDDIKPLSVLADDKTVGGIASKYSAEANSQNKRVKIDDPSFKGENTWRKEQSYGVKNGVQSSIYGSRNAKKSNELSKEPLANSASSKSDKRQWALEILARKSSLSNTGMPQSGEEDHHLLKGNYPLLAQLPKEMRPVPVSCSHNKIPMPVRQAQVYRLAEHFLKRAGVPGIHRTAEVELAVADAVNIEKEACERSKSKLVYVNLCSQHTIHSTAPRAEVADLTASPAEMVPNREATRPPSTDDSVEETLRLAGLLSDSPPSSPPNDLKGDPRAEDLGSEAKSVLSSSSDAVDGTMEQPSPGKDQVVTDLCESRAPEPDSSVSPKHLHGDDDAAADPCTPAPLKPSNDTCQPEMDPLESQRNEEPSSHGSEMEAASGSLTPADNTADRSRNEAAVSGCERSRLPMGHESTGRGSSSSHFLPTEPITAEEVSSDLPGSNFSLFSSGPIDSVPPLQVEAYIKEHVRPLCKSGVITGTDKVMRFHSKAKNASFLIKEGDKVKKLAEEYVAASQRKEWKPRPPTEGV
ncbi:unnamed protein product [Spirodela intermedia]|uniref:Zinc finger PHD-type domain-containing protein n=1 Tax=Spirodela intermedia TaxID=51605 RepID=A0A7I8J6P9_SPIIN|nr:unnamed protein product [Spirodela intermedia]CAA6665739.1 unnamed protein product [Spirodela intermedia]